MRDDPRLRACAPSGSLSFASILPRFQDVNAKSDLRGIGAGESRRYKNAIGPVWNTERRAFRGRERAAGMIWCPFASPTARQSASIQGRIFHRLMARIFLKNSFSPEADFSPHPLHLVVKFSPAPNIEWLFLGIHREPTIYWAGFRHLFTSHSPPSYAQAQIYPPRIAPDQGRDPSTSQKRTKILPRFQQSSHRTVRRD